MSKPRAKYEIQFASNKTLRNWDTLKEKFPDRMKTCESFLINNPEDRSKAIGILKKLRGRYKGILQYDITKDDYRVWYRVNRNDNTVVIAYAGSHP